MSEPVKGRGMSGKDVITVGIFSAIYFVINFAFMLLGGLHPLLWILMPGFIALFSSGRYIKNISSFACWSPSFARSNRSLKFTLHPSL